MSVHGHGKPQGAPLRPDVSIDWAEALEGARGKEGT